MTSGTFISTAGAIEGRMKQLRAQIERRRDTVDADAHENLVQAVIALMPDERYAEA